MNLNCAILHADPEIAGRLEEYIDKVPFLSLHGKYGNPLEALKDYYETKVEVYFVGIYPVEEGEINGMDFCRLLSSSTLEQFSNHFIITQKCPRPLVSFSLQTPTAMLPNVSVWMRWTI